MELVDTDKKDRPLQDIKIVNSGELVLKKKKHKGGSDDSEASSSGSPSQSSTSESESEDEKKSKKKSKKKKKKKDKKKAKRAKGSGSEDEDAEEKGEPHPLAQLTEIDPDEIPEVTHKFLHRGDSKKNDRERSRRKSGHRSRSRERKRSGNEKKLDKDGKKVKGRGRMTFRATSRSRSGTPPHWKSESRDGTFNLLHIPLAFLSLPATAGLRVVGLLGFRLNIPLLNLNQRVYEGLKSHNRHGPICKQEGNGPLDFGRQGLWKI